MTVLRNKTGRSKLFLTTFCFLLPGSGSPCQPNEGSQGSVLLLDLAQMLCGRVMDMNLNHTNVH